MNRYRCSKPRKTVCIKACNTREWIDAFILSRQARGLSSRTTEWYLGILRKFAALFPVLPFDPSDIERFILGCKAGDERRHGYYRTLRCFYHYLERRYEFPNPTSRIDAPRRMKKEPPILMPDQLDQLLSYPHIARIKSYLMFLIDTGCRVGELASLEPQNIIETPWGYLAKLEGKTGQRYVPISHEVYTAVLPYLPIPFSPYRLRRKISAAFREAHIPGSSLTLRHTFASLWMGDELVLQRIMGHSNLSTTQLYRHLRTQRLSEQHSQYTPLKYIFARTKTML